MIRFFFTPSSSCHNRFFYNFKNPFLKIFGKSIIFLIFWMFLHHPSKFGEFSLKIGGEIICQSWPLLTPFFNFRIVQWCRWSLAFTSRWTTSWGGNRSQSSAATQIQSLRTGFLMMTARTPWEGYLLFSNFYFGDDFHLRGQSHNLVSIAQTSYICFSQ